MPNRIKEIREAKGVSQDQLGERLGMTGMSVSRWERGVTRLKYEDIPRIAEALGVDPYEIVGNSPLLTAEEEALIDEYRHLPEDRKPNARPALRALNPQPGGGGQEAAD